LTAPSGLPCWLVADHDWFPELSCAVQFGHRNTAAANESSADDIANRGSFIEYIPATPCTIYLDERARN
jgi:hypothetical protein